ncbi:MAG TPA: nucleotide pyrophosphohydrolase [Sedimenticola thiotaurini]|uniref:Nucleotide pyrophosphohydrolase n=1 Tax=Sedimenticola thiotaurini TaxID=1543721 RepID=A0A831W9D5_9GAMM|nr:nucleotide pyrophosphohydrolase [Sedimenticola thiotaurini]
MTEDSLQQLSQRLKAFAVARDWEQFHSPKNLAMALIAECAELVEHFQWLTGEQSRNLPPEKREAVALEMADILIYLVRCAERLDIDLIDAANRKIAINESRYPAERVRGDARRADEYDPL